MNENILLSLKGITKQYPGVLALDRVDLDIREGETHALIGENGAGKSTLIKTLAGAIQANEGTIVFGGETIEHMSPALASQLGISVIYQEFNLMNSLTVAENVFMGHFPMKRKGLVDRKEMLRKTAEIFESMDVDMDPQAVVQDLSVAYMQLVEIAKSLSRNLKLLIMDEPTAPLTTKEVEVLFQIVKTLKKRGVTIIFISHRLDEIFSICDRVTVMRDGKKIATRETAEIDKNELIRLMVGREISNVYPSRDFASNETLLKVDNLCGNGVKNICLELHKGEVLGLAGLVGAGRTEIMRVLYGADPKEGGQVLMNGKPLKIRNPKDAVDNKIVLLPEDRKAQGLVLQLPISQNIALPNLAKLKRKGVLSRKAEKQMVEKEIADLHIACHSSAQLAGTLSGGNQQKVVLAKWLAANADVLIFDEPTRGIDVGAKYEIYLLMNELCRQGKAVLMISSDMEELLGMSDRIVVMYEGRQMVTLEKEQFSQETILKYASGEC